MLHYMGGEPHLKGLILEVSSQWRNSSYISMYLNCKLPYLTPSIMQATQKYTHFLKNAYFLNSSAVAVINKMGM